MKRQNLPLYALAGAVLLAGLAIAGVPLATVLPVLIALACPLMMLIMMSGMHSGNHDGEDAPTKRTPITHR